MSEKIEMTTSDRGCFIMWNEVDEFHHCFGGKNEVIGSLCPNCHKPLMAYLTLDCKDHRIGSLDLPFDFLPLLYCMRCALCWSDFVYKVESSIKIRILDVNEGPVMPEWYEAVGGDQFQSIPISLREIPDGIEDLFVKLNNNIKLTPSEVLDVATATGRFANEEVGGYPIADVTNQILGRAFLQQRFPYPYCYECNEQMGFLASLCNDSRNSIKLVYAGGQVVFFICRKCNVINVQSSA